MWRLFPITSEDTSLILSSHRQLNIYHKAQPSAPACTFGQESEVCFPKILMEQARNNVIFKMVDIEYV